jgi:hypothetical protein
MPRYAPLPRIELDPRSEVELVKAAARRVYEASSSTLNDFSSGSPIMALLEGQSFAQAEFLQFANEFPESVLVEWIGPFLGAQRRTGAGALVDVTFNIVPIDGPFVVFAGYQLGTDPNLTGGEQVKFVTLDRLTIPAGSVEGTVRCIAIETGTKGNVAPNTILKSLSSLAGVLSINNAEAASGGQDVELLSEVKERFFSLIRRRNPVSSEDWTDWFSDALGPGTTVIVLPRHSERGTYLYETDYLYSNPSVSFFVLNPDGTPITETQKNALETLMKWSLPVEFQGYIYPMEVDDVDINLTLEYDPSKAYAKNLHDLSATVRSSMFSLMTPNAVFPVDYDASVLDVQNALTSSFPITLGVDNRFTDPNIIDIGAYYTPTDIGVNTFVNVEPMGFVSGLRFSQGDLILENTQTGPYYYPVLTDFDPDNNSKSQYVNKGYLSFETIQELVPKQYAAGDVISYNQNIHVVLTPFFYSNKVTPLQLINEGILSAAKPFTPFEGSISNLNDSSQYDPDVISVEQVDFKSTIYVPAEPDSVPYNKRAGYSVYVATASFVVEPQTTTLGSAQNAGYISNDFVPVKLLLDDTTYAKGTFVKTPRDSELESNQFTDEYCYITEEEGLKEEYFLALEEFYFTTESSSYTAKVEELVLNGVLNPAKVDSFTECGRSVFKDKPFRYSTRFKLGEYVRYRERGGFSASELEKCFQQSERCDEVSGPCKFLLESSLPLPRYFQARKDFTPYTTDIDKMVADGVIEEVSRLIFQSTYSLVLDVYTYAYSHSISQAMIATGLISDVTDLKDGETVEVISDQGDQRGVYRWHAGKWEFIMPDQPVFRDMFRVAPDDVVSFRQESTVKSYRSVEHFTPIFEPDVYIKNGTLVRDEITTSNIQWIDPTYHVEDIVYEIINGAFSFYRVIAPVTPLEEELVWNSVLTLNTPRIQELKTKFLKIVSSAGCSDKVLSRLRDGASTTKLGVVNVTFKSKDSITSKDQFVWESTQYSTVTPSISYSPTISNWDYLPVDYGNGTLAL